MGKFVHLYLYIIIIITLLIPSCVQNKIINPIANRITRQIIKPTDVGGPIKFPITFYLEKSFIPEKVNIIKKAVEYWEIQTDGIVKVNIIPNWTAPTKFNDNYYRNYPIKTVWLLSREDPAVDKMFLKYNSFRGISYDNYIIIIKPENRTISDSDLYLVFMHEIGHQFGLHHIKDDYIALMNGDCFIPILTEWDMIQFCSLYDCHEKTLSILQMEHIKM